MRYAQFFHASTGYVPGSMPPRFDGERDLVEACGSDGVFPIDGRYGDARAASEARAACKRRGFAGFTLNAGPSYGNARYSPAGACRESCRDCGRLDCARLAVRRDPGRRVYGHAVRPSRDLFGPLRRPDSEPAAHDRRAPQQGRTVYGCHGRIPRRFPASLHLERSARPALHRGGRAVIAFRMEWAGHGDDITETLED